MIVLRFIMEGTLEQALYVRNSEEKTSRASSSAGRLSLVRANTLLKQMHETKSGNSTGKSETACGTTNMHDIDEDDGIVGLDE